MIPGDADLIVLGVAQALGLAEAPQGIVIAPGLTGMSDRSGEAQGALCTEERNNPVGAMRAGD